MKNNMGANCVDDVSASQLGDDVEELLLGNREGRKIDLLAGGSGHVGYILRAVEIDQIELLDNSGRSDVGEQRRVASPTAIPLVDQKLMAVDRDDLAHARTIRQLIGI